MAAQLAEEAFLIFVANSPILIGVSDKTDANPTVVYRYGEDSINLRGLTANN
jgi:peptide/nickel transport system substrate-binding protein